jgi:hypothetical protein
MHRHNNVHAIPLQQTGYCNASCAALIPGLLQTARLTNMRQGGHALVVRLLAVLKGWHARCALRMI